MSLRSLEGVSLGEELPPRSRVVTAEDVRAYADLSGDRNPLHLDEGSARAAGFDGLIAHGMFTMGHLASMIADWAGEATAIVSMSAQFRTPVVMGDRIVAAGRVRAIDEAERSVTLETWVGLEGDENGWPVRRGEAVVRLA